MVHAPLYNSSDFLLNCNINWNEKLDQTMAIILVPTVVHRGQIQEHSDSDD